MIIGVKKDIFGHLLDVGKSSKSSTLFPFYCRKIMANLSIVILPAKALKGGKHKIRVSISHNGKTRYIPTDIVVNSVDEFSNGFVRKRADASYLNSKIRGIVQTYQELLDDIAYKDCLSCEDLVASIKMGKKTASLSLQDLYEDFISLKNTKASTLLVYKTRWNAITKHISKDIPVKELKPHLVAAIESGLRKRKLSNTTINHILAFLGSMVNHARRSGYVEFKIDPLIYLKKPSCEIRDAWLTVEQIKTIRDVKLSRTNGMYRDMFMLSYYLGGMNAADLLSIDFRNCKEKMSYVRTKTSRINKKPVVFDIPEEAFPIIERLTDKSGKLRFRKENNGRDTQIRTNITHNMKRLSKLLGIPNLIFYSARKSFAQHAFLLNVNEAVIDYILGHSDHQGRTSNMFYRFTTPEMATKAIRKVLDNLK